ncbi:MAG: DCC1-like thiol-disulfide oxidoreductase family protein [Henriciella sp.]
MAKTEANSKTHAPFPDPDQDGVIVVYDGECPFCARYVSMLRLREVAGNVALIDARSNDPIAAWARHEFDLDEGMAVRMHDTWRLGGDAINALALLTGPSSFMNRVNYLVFKNKHLSRFVYPVLRMGRNLALRLLGRRRIVDDFTDTVGPSS